MKKTAVAEEALEISFDCSNDSGVVGGVVGGVPGGVLGADAGAAPRKQAGGVNHFMAPPAPSAPRKGRRLILAPGFVPPAPSASCRSHPPRKALKNHPTAPPPNFNTEEYNRLYENQFRKSLYTPLSTFSIDVDTGSYSNIRRFLNRHSRPPKDAVRIEEMINYFSYDYPKPKGKHPFSISTDLAPCPWNDAHVLLHIGIKGKTAEPKNLPPSNLVFLLDVSGSMNNRDKLPLLKSSFKLLVDQLREKDRVAVVVYAGAAGLVLESTPGDRKKTIHAAIDKLSAGGSTAGGEGIRLAYTVAQQNCIPGGNNRIILATDGDFNVGVSSTSQLIRMIEEKRKKGIFLTTMGFGTGNYKDHRLEQLADKGNGCYFYIDNIMEGQKVFVHDLRGTLFTIAKDVKIQVEFNPVLVDSHRLIGYENRVLKKEDFNDDQKDAGELGAGH
ncbi:MAG: VWA domain-containing protein, partial [bacterium]|nr:VWA domain-containing protein [bacterium]